MNDCEHVWRQFYSQDAWHCLECRWVVSLLGLRSRGLRGIHEAPLVGRWSDAD